MTPVVCAAGVGVGWPASVAVAEDALLEQARTASSPGERMTFIASAEAQLLADIAVIPIFFRVSKRLVKPHVAGVQANPLGQLASRDLALQPH